MARFILIISLLLIPGNFKAHEFKESDTDRLLLLPGKVDTYYSDGCGTDAKYLKELVEDAVSFFENKLQDTFDIRLLVLNRRDWKSIVGGSYFLSQFEKNPDRIEMVIHKSYKIKLADDKTLYGRKEAIFWDFIAVHELGHYISQRNKVKSLIWTSEFFADYVFIGFLLEKIPEFRLNPSIGVLFRYLPFKYKSLKDMVENSSRIDPLNYIFYEGKLEELAIGIFRKRGWDFMYDYIDRFRNVTPPVTKTNLVELSISEFRKMEPEIFSEWLQGMKQTYHPLLIFCILIAISAGIRIADNSYIIFNRLGLGVKNKYRIFGVPASVIGKELKSITNKKQRRKLKVIIGLRPLMYLCIILIILLLTLHH